MLGMTGRELGELVIDVCGGVASGDIPAGIGAVALTSSGVPQKQAHHAIRVAVSQGMVEGTITEEQGKALVGQLAELTHPWGQAEPGDVFISTWCSDPRGKAGSRFNALADDYKDLLNMTMIAIRQRCVEFVEYERAKAGASTRMLSE